MKTCLVLLLLFAVTRVQAADAPGSAAAVTKEGDLVIVTLTPEAEQRLRLKRVPVEKRAVPATRLFSGEVVTPLAADGKSVAPVLGGTLDEVLRLADLQVAADGRIQQAQVQVDAAKVAVGRAEKVLNAAAGSVRSVDEAKAALELAQAALATAKAQRELLGAPVGQPDAARRAWVRVAIYAGEAPLLDAKATASVRSIGSKEPALNASPVAGPPTANGLVNTIDWYYSLPPEAALRAGERVAVEVPTKSAQQDSLVVPFKAVLHDIHGGQWVYEQTHEHAYTRRRVQVDRVVGADAVLASGPAPGTQIVTDGAAELFGTEFMTGK